MATTEVSWPKVVAAVGLPFFEKVSHLILLDIRTGGGGGRYKRMAEVTATVAKGHKKKYYFD